MALFSLGDVGNAIHMSGAVSDTWARIQLEPDCRWLLGEETRTPISRALSAGVARDP